MRIYNGTYKQVNINWDSVTLPIKEGSPISAAGVVSNDEDAIGLCPVHVWKKTEEDFYILIGGDVYISEVEAAYGAELTDDAIASMGGINFYENDGTIDKASGGGGGGTGALIVHYDSGTAQLDKTFKEISDAILAGTPVILFYIDGDMVSHNYCYSVYVAEDELYEVAFGSVYRDSQGRAAAAAWVFSADSENDYPVED